MTTQPADEATTDLAAVIAAHELIGKSAPARDDHNCRRITKPHDGCGCTRIVVGCTGCDWLTEALDAAADKWQQGAWGSTPRHADRVADRMAASQFALDWLRDRAEAERRGEPA